MRADEVEKLSETECDAVLGRFVLAALDASKAGTQRDITFNAGVFSVRPGAGSSTIYEDLIHAT